MNLSTIRTEVRDILGELTADFWTEAELNRYANEALRRFIGENRWSWLITEGSATLLAGDPDLTLTEGVADYRHLNIMLTKTGDVRPYLPKKVTPLRGFQLRQSWYTAQSYPTWFYVTNVSDSADDGSYETVVKFIPPPNEACDVEYQYYRTPDLLTADNDVPDIPIQYHKALVHYTAGTAWLKELTAGGKATEQFQMYDAIVAEAKGDEESNGDDDFIVAGGSDYAERGSRFDTVSDYALRRIAPTLGP